MMLIRKTRRKQSKLPALLTKARADLKLLLPKDACDQTTPNIIHKQLANGRQLIYNLLAEFFWAANEATFTK